MSTPTPTTSTYPSGHTGHLSTDQQSSLDRFKALCTESGHYQPLVPDHEHPSHSDETLLRFLRARRWIPKDALDQFVKTEKWMQETRLGEMYEKVDVDEYESARRMYPQWTGRRDKRGFPLYLYEIAPLHPKSISAFEKTASSIQNLSTGQSRSTPVKLLRLFVLIASLAHSTFPWCSTASRPFPETPISASINIVDISGVGLKKFWELNSHLAEASKLATEHYPESLGRILIIGAPSFFPTVWSWIKGYFDQNTVNKVHILSSSEVFHVLSQHIDPENIPKKYGGSLDFTFGDLPNLDPELTSRMTWYASQQPSPNNSNGMDGSNDTNEQGSSDETAVLPIGPIRWEKGENGKMDLIAVGTEEGKARRLKVATLDADFDEFLHPTTKVGQSFTSVERDSNGVKANDETTQQVASRVSNDEKDQCGVNAGISTTSTSSSPANDKAHSVPGSNANDKITSKVAATEGDTLTNRGSLPDLGDNQVHSAPEGDATIDAPSTLPAERVVVSEERITDIASKTDEKAVKGAITKLDGLAATVAA